MEINRSKIMEEIKTRNYRGYDVIIVCDQKPTNPRNWENLGTIYSILKEYNPDGHTLSELISTGFKNKDGEFSSEMLNKGYVWLNVYAYISDGISIRCGEQFSGPEACVFGIIAVSKEKAMKKLGYQKIGEKEEREIKEILFYEIELLDLYYDEEEYGFEIKKDGKTIFSKYGYLGDNGLKIMEEEYINAIDDKIGRGERVINDAEEYEPITISLDPGRTPKAYYNRVFELTQAGHTRKEAERLAMEPIECEIYYEVGRGVFALESGAVESGIIYSPYTMEEYIDIS